MHYFIVALSRCGVFYLFAEFCSGFGLEPLGVVGYFYQVVVVIFGDCVT